MSKKNSRKRLTQPSASQPISPNLKSHKSVSNLSTNVPLTVSPKFTAIVILQSDWHIGTGAGRSGDIDSLVQRDQQGFPFIPAKTLTGIWRDACELIAQGLDNENPEKIWLQWVNYLFGNQPAVDKRPEVQPYRAAFSIRSAYLPQELKEAIASKPDFVTMHLKEALTFVKPGIKVDFKTGCAEEKCLRFVEMARSGAILTAECELNLEGLDSEQQKAAYALLVAATRLVERIGGNRRRGAGRCALIIDGIDPTLWIDWIEEHLNPPPLPNSDLLITDPTWYTYLNDDKSAWEVISLKITAKTPLTIAKRTVGNVVETLDYIPGTHLLGAIVRKLKSLKTDLSGAIAHGDLIVTNGTLEINNQPGKSVPYALFGEKLSGGLAKEGKVYNRFVEIAQNHEQLKGERQGYIECTKDDGIHFASVRVGVETHNTILDEKQRPDAEVGGVYSYETIAPGTVLRAELRLPKLLSNQLAEQKAAWWRYLEGDAYLGQSKKDDYGLVSIRVHLPSQEEKSTKAEKEKPKKENLLIVWLLSDVLLRDERLRPTTSITALQQELGKKLDITLKLRENTDLESIMARSRRIESWQVKWGLPRPSLVGLSAGSCFVFDVTGDVEESKLAQLELVGIGDRRAEGYGQICFNGSLLTEVSKLKIQKFSSESSSSSSQKLISQGDKAFRYAQIIEKAAWRTAIQREALRVAGDRNTRQEVLGISKNPNVPSFSQLGGLRSLVNQLQTHQDNAIKGWFGNESGNDLEKEKWKKRKEKWGEFLQIPYNLVTSPDRIWEILKIPTTELTLTENGERELKKILWAEAIQALIDICIRSYKES